MALPSLADNLPNAALEAMGFARPIIATTGSCFEQLITDGESGLLVAPDDPRKLARAIARAWSMSDGELAAPGQRDGEAAEIIGQPAAVARLGDVLGRDVAEAHQRVDD